MINIQCLNCFNQQICKVYAVATFNLTISNCSHYKNSLTSLNQTDLLPEFRPTVEERSKIIQSLQQENKDKQTSLQIVCPSCNVKTKETYKCASCDAIICDGCCTHTFKKEVIKTDSGPVERSIQVKICDLCFEEDFEERKGD